MNRILELFGIPAKQIKSAALKKTLKRQICPFTRSRCFKVRKSQPEISIGTCSVCYGKENKNILICPKRLLQNRKVFCDCIHLLTLHEPGNEFHVIPEVSVPGGSIDFFLVSAKQGKVKDFVAIEFQTLDTTGTLWPERQRLLEIKGIPVNRKDVFSKKSFGMNWKMTAKTTLVQLLHKVETIEHFGKHLVLVIQDHFLEYMRGEFCFDHLASSGRIGDSTHLHSYSLISEQSGFALELSSRFSTDADGIATCLGLQADPKIEMQAIVLELERKLSAKTLITIP